MTGAWVLAYDVAMHSRAQELIRSLRLSPHPEGGAFREVFRATGTGGGAGGGSRHSATRTTGAYTLAGCTVTPGFDFADFVLLSDDPEATTQLRRHFPEAERFLLAATP